MKRNEPAIRADNRRPTSAVGLEAGRSNADTFDTARLPVKDKNVACGVGIIGDEIRCTRFKSHESPIRADGRREAVFVGFNACGGHAHAIEQPCLAVEDENVIRAAGFCGVKIGGT